MIVTTAMMRSFGFMLDNDDVLGSAFFTFAFGHTFAFVFNNNFVLGFLFDGLDLLDDSGHSSAWQRFPLRWLFAALLVFFLNDMDFLWANIIKKMLGDFL